MKNQFRKVINGFGFAFSGILNTFITEINFRIHIIAMLIVVIMGVIFHLSTFEWLWVLLAIFLVIAAELMNTALESLANSVTPNFDPLIKKSKDAAAGAVLTIAIFAIVIAIVIFGPKLASLIPYPL